MLKSTCNIVLTTDICPNALIESNNNNAQHDRCTTHTYTFSPDQVFKIEIFETKKNRVIQMANAINYNL